MTGFTYSILFKLAGQNSISQAVNLTDRLDRSVNRANGDISRMGGTMQRAGNQGRNAFNGLRSSVMSWVASLGLGIAALGSLNTAAQAEGFEQAIMFADAKNGAQNLDFIRQTSDALGISIQNSYTGFQKLQGGLMGTNITAQQTRDIFYSVGEAGSVMRLSGDQMNGVFLALSQIASKGTVQAEELRGQLGERLPGAFSIAARAMGVSTQELNKMLEKGQVISEQFLPAFAAELHKTFGSGVEEATQSATANFGRFQTATFELKRVFGEELMPTVLTFLQNVLIPGMKWIGENISVIIMLSGAIGTAVVSYKAIIMATKMWKLEMFGLNAAFKANPIGFVISLIAGLTAGVIYAWNKFEGFRGFIMGMWEVIKEFGKIIYDYAVAPLLSMGKTLLGVFTFDKALIEEGIRDSFSTFEKMSQGIGQRVAASFAKGYKNGIDSFAEKSSPGNNLDAVRSQFTGLPSVPGSGSPSSNINASAKSGISAITGGGRKNITINLQSLVQGLTINTATASEGTDEMGAIVERKLLQVLNSANQTQ